MRKCLHPPSNTTASVLLTAAFFFLFSFFQAHAELKEKDLSTAKTGGGEIIKCHPKGERGGLKIAEALAKLKKGSVLHLMPAEYESEISVSVKGVIIEGEPGYYYRNRLNIRAEDCIVRNIWISSMLCDYSFIAVDSIIGYFHASAQDGGDVFFRNCCFEDMHFYSYAKNKKINLSNCTLNSFSSAITLSGGDWTIENCVLCATGKALTCWSSGQNDSRLKIKNSIIYGGECLGSNTRTGAVCSDLKGLKKIFSVKTEGKVLLEKPQFLMEIGNIRIAYSDRARDLEKYILKDDSPGSKEGWGANATANMFYELAKKNQPANISMFSEEIPMETIPPPEFRRMATPAPAETEPPEPPDDVGDEMQGTAFVVQALQTQASPLATGLRVKKGQKFTIYPNKEDKWTGGGTKANLYCGYMGYDDRGNMWMRLHCRVGNAQPEPVVDSKEMTAEADGELFLYAYDDKAAGNVGQIRVAVALPEDALDKDLVAYYPFNGNANDESGSGNNGTVHGATLTADRFGNAGKAYSFDGDDYIDCGNSSDFNLNEHTITCWIIVSSNFQEGGNILGKVKPLVYESLNFCLDSKKRMSTWFATGGEINHQIAGLMPIEEDKWCFIGIRYDGSKVCFFKDGRLDSDFPRSGEVRINEVIAKVQDCTIKR